MSQINSPVFPSLFRQQIIFTIKPNPMKFVFTLFITMAFLPVLLANNISISNLSLTGKNTTDHYTMVQFDISWENSWRKSTAESNWDAAWVFVKYRVAGGAWQHAWLNEDGHTAPAGSTLTPGLLTPDAAFNATTNPGLGAFIYRDANGTGTFSKTGVQLRWNYGANGVADGDLVEFKLFAIEMVYVPQGEFKVGSGGTESGSFTNGSWTGGATIPLSISSEITLTIGPSAGNLWGTSGSGSNTIGGTGTLGVAFPKGYGAFYCMKYEISQQQYVDFLNTITSTQAANRYSSGSTGYRYGISASGGVYSTSNPYVACNFLSWMDGAAYTDWAGLRPMTELEFEKACRGTATPVANEYAWGNTTAIAANNITNGGASNETTNTTDANAVFHNHPIDQAGPMRTGVFATGSTSRAQAGSTYFGIMEMTGNLWERTVTLGSPTGRAFTGVHGNGTLSTAGNADISTWPGYVTTEVTGATGSGFRGGSFLDDYMNISNRQLGSFDYSARFNNDGFRAVRTQPPFTCGVSTITINHVTTGGVAPVDKPVTYGTTSTTLFGGTKCAITRNLGASQQATAANDATEASAGWYWQFNRKQGWEYKTSRLPVTPAWVSTNDNLSATWEAAKDPCTLEFGAGWRIPTNTEWTAANTNGSWGNYTDTYNSLLKLHAAGYLSNSDGSLNVRGSGGYYWSSTQYDATNGWYLDFYSGFSYMSYNGKAYGFAVRCLKDLLPTVTTTAVTSITSSTASSGGNVTDDGGSTITARGVCWSTTANPVATGSHTTDAGTTGIFTSNIIGLSAGTIYHVRAYATNAIGTAYGNDLSFTTTASCFIAGTKISMADGSVKNIEDVLVGDQVKSVNTETMEIVTETVTNTFANLPAGNLTKITFSNGQTNTNTKNHPYWVVGKGWSCVDPAAYSNSKVMNAALLAVGDQCQILENGNLVTVTVTAIEDQPQMTVPTFNFKVNQTKCYFANGVLVHNKT
jgi:hypothetical protein